MKTKHLTTCRLLLLCSLLVSMHVAMGQGANPPDHRLALRWNTLGILNLNGIGDIEYAVSRRVGVFAGGGSKVALVYPDRLVGFSRYLSGTGKCRSTDWGIYLGARIAIPAGRLSGLAIKGWACYQRVKMLMPPGCYETNPDAPFVPNPVYYRQTIGAYVGIAYTQGFAGRFFVEPVVGFGPEIYAHDRRGSFKYLGFELPLQLNAGVRF